MNLNIKSIMAKLPVPFWLVFYIFLILIVIPTLAYLGNFGKAVPGDWQWHNFDNGTFDPDTAWKSVTVSNDGSKQSVVNLRYIYTSTDSGATWVQRSQAGARSWKAIADNDDGTKLVAVVGSEIDTGYIYTSTDSGAT